MTFSGVRSSCETIARKSSFIRLEQVDGVVAHALDEQPEALLTLLELPFRGDGDGVVGVGHVGRLALARATSQAGRTPTPNAQLQTPKPNAQTVD